MPAALYKGYCYSSMLEAGKAVAVDWSSFAPFANQSASGTGGAISYTTGVFTQACYTQAPYPGNDSYVNVTCAGNAYARSGQPTFTTGTISSLSMPSPGTITLTFPSCTLPNNYSDQVGALNSIWVLFLGALVAIWGIKQIINWLSFGRGER